jgi:hypothetical protein
VLADDAAEEAALDAADVALDMAALALVAAAEEAEVDAEPLGADVVWEAEDEPPAPVIVLIGLTVVAPDAQVALWGRSTLKGLQMLLAKLSVAEMEQALAFCAPVLGEQWKVLNWIRTLNGRRRAVLSDAACQAGDEVVVVADAACVNLAAARLCDGGANAWFLCSALADTPPVDHSWTCDERTAQSGRLLVSTWASATALKPATAARRWKRIVGACVEEMLQKVQGREKREAWW